MTRWPAKEEMEARILATADRLFYGHGLRAVGVDMIAAEVGISKRTLYNYFPSKDALIAAYLLRRAVPRKPSGRPPLEQILTMFDWLERWFGSDDFRGCPFVNAVTELGEPDHPGARIAADYKERRWLWYRDLLTELGVKDPDVLATQMTVLVEGAIISALVRGDPGVARAAKDAARVLLTQAGAMKSANAGMPNSEQATRKPAKLDPKSA